ncbi:MAG: copper homeostasis protein CutC, partial [Jiangellaceae bacterium]
MEALLEITVLGPADVAGAAQGGADRLELARDIDAGGLVPDVRTLRDVRRESDLPVRAVLRANEGFATTGSELSRLKGAAQLLAAGGADGFVLGFLGPTSEIDVDVTLELIAELSDLPWTHHRAIDHALDYDSAWEAVRGLPGMDTVLTAGSARGVG